MSVKDPVKVISKESFIQEISLNTLRDRVLKRIVAPVLHLMEMPDAKYSCLHAKQRCCLLETVMRAC